MKFLLPLLAVAALVAVPAASAVPSAPPTLQPGKLIVAFGDPAPGFAQGTVRGNTDHQPARLRGRPRVGDRHEARAHARSGCTRRGTACSRPARRSSTSPSRRRRSPSQRKQTVDFTSSYLNANQGVLLSKQATAPNSLADLKKHADLRADEHDGPRLDQDAAASGEEAARVPDDDRRVSGGADQQVPGDDPRRAARQPREEAEPVEVRPRRRPGRHARAVRRRAPEGLEAAADREQRR